MEAVAFSFKIGKEDEGEYRKRHRNVDPELLEDFKAAGIRNYRIFLHEGTLFAYMEVDDLEGVNAYLSRSEANFRWGRFMSDLFGKPGAGVRIDLEEVFRFEARA